MTYNVAHTASLIVRMAYNELNGLNYETSYRLPAKKRVLNTSLFGRRPSWCWSRKNKAITENIRTAPHVFAVTKESLIEVLGIGVHTATRILNCLHQKY